jgi:adenylyltransferase/sulfurtransferase
MVPDLPPPGAVPSCAEAGVLGVLPGVMGTLQAVEALKLLLGIGTVPLGRLLCYDALRSEFRTLRLRRDPDCALCGARPRIHSVANPQTTASTTCGTVAPVMDPITTSELRDLLAGGFQGLLIDVREPFEHAMAHIPGARLIPLGTLPGALDTLPHDRDLFVICMVGVRSARAVDFLVQNGFPRARNVEGGMDAWLAGE